MAASSSRAATANPFAFSPAFSVVRRKASPAATIEHAMMVSGETKFDLALAAIKGLSNTAATPIVVLAQLHLEARLFHAFCFSIISSGITRAIMPPRVHYTTNHHHYIFISPSQSTHLTPPRNRALITHFAARAIAKNNQGIEEHGGGLERL